MACILGSTVMCSARDKKKGIEKKRQLARGQQAGLRQRRAAVLLLPRRSQRRLARSNVVDGGRRKQLQHRAEWEGGGGRVGKSWGRPNQRSGGSRGSPACAQLLAAAPEAPGCMHQRRRHARLQTPLILHAHQEQRATHVLHHLLIKVPAGAT